MRTRRAFLALAAASAIAIFGVALPSAALDLDSAKQQGLVGEQTDGYIASVSDTPSPDVVALVTDVNKKRRAAYQEIAQKNGTNIKDVGVLAAQKLIERAPSRAWIRDQGQWYQKQ
jgi:uncharacterized protein YdbL (DUF1318 family)